MNDLIRRWTKSSVGSLVTSNAALLVGALYAIGLAITNMHLAGFGVHDFSGLKVQFVFTGLLFIIFLTLPGAPVLTALWAWRTTMDRSTAKPLRVVFAAATGILVWLFASILLNALLDPDSYTPDQRPAWPSLLYGWRLYLLRDDRGSWDGEVIALMVLIYSSAAVLFGSAPPPAKAGQSAWASPFVRTAMSCVLVMSVYKITGNYSYGKHRHLKAAFGGAAYGALDLALKDEVAKRLGSLCVPLNERGILERAPALYETDAAFVVLRPLYDWEGPAGDGEQDYATFRISKDDVVGAQWTAGADLKRRPVGLDARSIRCAGWVAGKDR